MKVKKTVNLVIANVVNELQGNDKAAEVLLAVLRSVHTDGINGIPFSQAIEALEAIEEEKVSLYADFITAYAAYFHQNKVPFKRITPQDGKAMKEIIKTLMALDVCEGDEVKALQAWQLVLSNADKLNAFLKSQTLKLANFNKYFVEILTKLRNDSKFRPNEKEAKLGKYA